MNPDGTVTINGGVVLLAEDVDRNADTTTTIASKTVVLLAEDVDRNLWLSEMEKESNSRPPRGGRG